MEKDFTHIKPLIFCPVCGARNTEDELNCKVCKAPLVQFSLYEKEEKLFDGFDEQMLIFDEIRALKEALLEIKKKFLNLDKEIKDIKDEIRGLYNYFNSLKEILEENDYLRIDELKEKWKEKEILSANIEEQLEHFLNKKEDILSRYKGKDFNGFRELIEKALVKFKVQDLKSAKEILKRALKKDKNNVELLNFLSFLSLKNKIKEEADLYLKRSLKIEENPEAIFLKAWSLSSEEKYKEALDLIKTIKNGFPNPFLLNVMEGNLNFSLKNYKNAINSFEDALNYLDSPYVRFLLFKCFFNLNKKRVAIGHLERIKEDEYFREEALYNLGKINLELKKRRTALNYLGELIDEFPFKLKYQMSFLFARENLDMENFKNSKEYIKVINKKIEEEDFKKISRLFQKLHNRYPKEPFFFLSYLLFKTFKDKEKDIEKIKIFLKEENREIYKILGYLIYLEILKNFHNKKLILKVSNDFYENCNSYLGKAISLLFLSKIIYEVEKNEENALKFSKEALILMPDELKIYAIENFASLLFKIEKKEEIYDILKELSENIKEEDILLNLGKIALNIGKEKDAKEIFKNMRDFQGKPQGIIFKYWKELFNEIRSYLV